MTLITAFITTVISWFAVQEGYVGWSLSEPELVVTPLGPRSCNQASIDESWKRSYTIRNNSNERGEVERIHLIAYSGSGSIVGVGATRKEGVVVPETQPECSAQSAHFRNLHLAPGGAAILDVYLLTEDAELELYNPENISVPFINQSRWFTLYLSNDRFRIILAASILFLIIYLSVRKYKRGRQR